MKGLAIAGTAAMFLVGGSIIRHGIPALHHLADSVVAWAAGVPGAGTAASLLAPLLVDALVGIAAGALAVGAVTVLGRLRPATPAANRGPPAG
jgi:predicted DNA repair protein MutK